MKLKKGDKVIVIAGKDKGKKGVILSAHPDLNRVVVEGINISKIHQKSRTKGKPGEIISRPQPIHASNVMLVDPKTGGRTRVSIKNIGGKNIRVSKKSSSEFK
ncbi:MAG: 50S ribosomal protein L24 [Candidatus Pacebacteria bacterium]|nr:50S ribosomal protein L24 [Candidatus Paceibacterota bacterium]